MANVRLGALGLLIAVVGCSESGGPDAAGAAGGPSSGGSAATGGSSAGGSNSAGGWASGGGGVGGSTSSSGGSTSSGGVGGGGSGGTSGAAAFKIYVAPDGSDTADGLTVGTSIQTLTRAHEILVNQSVTADVEIQIAPGRYQAQTTVWTYTLPNHTITFMPLGGGSDRPVFDGCTVENVTDAATQCPGGTWLRLKHSAGEETNLHFSYIRVERYGTAISLDGSRNEEPTSNGSNRIYGCYFDQIGNIFNPALPDSTAAVRLVNSDDNEIINNHFIRIENASASGLLHAIYVAHMSDRNIIKKNRFKKGSGDPIRVRDFSNDNVVNENRFIQIGKKAAYSHWYCDHEVRDDCTKVGPECPSWGNQFRDNLLDGDYQCAPLSGFNYAQDDATAGCAPPSPSSVRLRTSGNTKHTPPCTSE